MWASTGTTLEPVVSMARASMVALDSGRLNRCAGSFREGAHVVGVGLGCEVGVFAFAMERILGDRSAEAAAIAVDDGDAHA